MNNQNNNFSDRVLNALKQKVVAHNLKYAQKVTLSQLQKVYRRGSEMFSEFGRPGKSRGQWAIARTNMFLKMIQGSRVKDSYRKADQDIAEAGIIDDYISIELNNNNIHTFTIRRIQSLNISTCS